MVDDAPVVARHQVTLDRALPLLVVVPREHGNVGEAPGGVAGIGGHRGGERGSGSDGRDGSGRGDDGDDWSDGGRSGVREAHNLWD